MPGAMRGYYAILDVTPELLGDGAQLVARARALLAARPCCLQLRAKGAGGRALAAAARPLLAACREAGVPFCVNDRLDVALAANADGVHLGPGDLPIHAARLAAPRPFLIGASTDDPATAQRLEADGADYIGCGAVFGTTTKDVGEERIGPEGVAAVAAAVSIPVVGIGGIDGSNAHLLRGTGAAGVAVVGAVMAAPDPGAATREILAALANGRENGAGQQR